MGAAASKAQHQGKQNNDTDQEAYHGLLKVFRIFMSSFTKDAIEAALFKSLSKYLCHQPAALLTLHTHAIAPKVWNNFPTYLAMVQI